ncbi:hypothetical protein EBR66_02715 [bacterium]|nr:hypothetical protein [bacterium]
MYSKEMSGVPIIDQSTSVIQINSTGNSSVVYLSSTNIPGQLVTVFDATGFISSPQSIRISTVGTTAPPLFIQQRYGYITLLSEGPDIWAPVNYNSFPTPSSISYKAADITFNTTSTLYAKQYISSISVSDVALEAKSSFMQQVILSTLSVNNYIQYLSTPPTEPSILNTGNMYQLGSTQYNNRYNVRSNVSTLGDIYVGGSISSKTGTICISEDLNILGSYRAQRGQLARIFGLSTLSSATFAQGTTIASSLYVTGPVLTPAITSDSLAGNTYTVTSSITFGNGQQAIQYTPGYLNFVNISIAASTLQTSNVTGSNTIATSNLIFTRFDPANTTDTFLASTATMVNTTGSLRISSIRANECRTSTNLVAPTMFIDRYIYASTLNIQDTLSTSYAIDAPSSILSSHTSYISTAGVSRLISENETFIRAEMYNMRVYSSMFFSSATMLSMNSTSIYTLGGNVLTGRLDIESTLTANSLQMNILSSPNTISFEGQTNAYMSNLLTQTISSSYIETSSLVTGNAQLGDRLVYSTIDTKAPWILASTFQMNTTPFMTSVGLGTYYDRLKFTAVSDQAAYYSVIDPSAQTPSQLSTVYVNTLAGTGTRGQQGNQLGQILGAAAVDSQSGIYIGDNTLGWKLRYISSSRSPSTIAGNYQYYYGTNVPSQSAAMSPTLAISMASPGTFVVTDISNQVLRFIDSQPVITTIAGTGAIGNTGNGGPALNATFFNPSMTVVDASQNIFIADTGNNVIRRYTSTNIYAYAGTGIAGASGDGGPALNARFQRPYGLALDSSQKLYITDLSNSVIRTVDPLTSTVNLYAGTYTSGFTGDGGLAVAARLSYPRGIAVDTQSNVYVCDTGNSRIRRIDALTGIISTIAGNGVEAYSGASGPGYLASLSTPTGVTTDAGGNLYIADTKNNCIRFLDIATGILTTIAGEPPNAGYNGENIFANAALLSSPTHVVFDSATSNLYFTDEGNARVRFVDINSGILYTYAGNGSPATDIDNLPASNALFQSITSVAADLQKNIYIADGQGSILRKYDARTQIVSTVVGTGAGGYTPDGPGLQTSIRNPTALVVNSNNNVYFCDTQNHMIRVYNSTFQTVQTIAGIGSPGYSGDGGYAYSAELNFPRSLAIDTTGNIYVGDTSNYVIRRIDTTTGVITTYAGDGSYGSILPGALATASPLGNVTGLTTDATNQVYFTEIPTNALWTVLNIDQTLQPISVVSTPSYLGDGGPLSTAQFHTPVGLVMDLSNNFLISDSGNYRLRRSYTYGNPQNPIYLNMNMQFTNYQATTGSVNININGNAIATFTPSSLNSTLVFQDVNIYSFPLQSSNPVYGNQTPYVQITQTGNTGYLKLDGTLWFNATPGGDRITNLLTSNNGLTIQSGILRFPNALQGITLQNSYNDTSTRSLFYTGSLNNASDPALKEQVDSANISLCYENLASIPLRTYRYTTAYESTFQLHDTTRMGFLTREISPIFPKSIQTTPFKDWLSSIETLDMSQIKYSHIGATQYLMQEISSMESYIQTLRSLRCAATQRNVMH